MNAPNVKSQNNGGFLRKMVRINPVVQRSFTTDAYTIFFESHPDVTMTFSTKAFEYKFPHTVMEGYRELYFKIKKEGILSTVNNKMTKVFIRDDYVKKVVDSAIKGGMNHIQYLGEDSMFVPFKPTTENQLKQSKLVILNLMKTEIENRLENDK
jgi:hypothetical protein